MASSSVQNPRKSKRGRVAQAAQEPPLQITSGRFDFVTPSQESRFNVLSRKVLCAQKFVDIATLRELHIYTQIRALFRNIGWEGVLDLHANSYTQPTLEVLSSVEFNKRTQILSFRLFNSDQAVHVNEICQLVNAPTDHARAPSRDLEFHHLRRPFWKAISNMDNYDSSSAKASRILHPVLRVAHRIICSIFFPQEETSKCGARELELLWAMVHCPPQKPHFGYYLIDKFLKIAKRSDGQIHCGGIVTLLGRLPSVNIHFPDTLDAIRGETRLRSSILVNMHIIRKDGNTIIWQVDRRDYLSIDNRRKNLLNLATPISDTNWCIPSNMGVEFEADEEEEDESEEEQEEPEPAAYPPPHTGSSSDYQANYMAQFERLHGSIQDLRNDISHYHADLEEIDTNYHDLDYRHTSFMEAQMAHNESVDAYMREQRAHNASMASLLGNFRNVHLGNPSAPSYPIQPFHQDPPPPGTQMPRFSGPYPPYPSYPHYPPPPPQP